MKPFITALILSGLSILTGCDTMSGVIRDAKLDSFPPLDCIEKTISSTPGVASVKTWVRNDPYTVHYFSYHGAERSHIIGTVYISQNEAGVITFSQSLTELNGHPPQEDIDATRPVMKVIEERLEAVCGVAQLQAHLREQCLDVQCRSLESTTSAGTK